MSWGARKMVKNRAGRRRPNTRSRQYAPVRILSITSISSISSAELPFMPGANLAVDTRDKARWNLLSKTKLAFLQGRAYSRLQPHEYVSQEFRRGCVRPINNL